MKMSKGAAAAALIMAAGAVSACAEAPAPKVEVKMTESTKADLATLKNTRVFFAHHSVGENIMDGMKALEKEAGVPLNWAKAGAAPAEGGVFVDAQPGKNTEPKTKVAGFVQALKDKQDGGAQIALMKFCYIDFPPEADVKDIFDDYVKGVAAVKAARPELTLVHMTVPLGSRSTGWKDQLRRLLGRGVWGDEANIRRNAFNKLLRAHFKQEPIFDLAKVESTAPDGARLMHEDGGKSYYAMLPAYTSDGGHLNTAGQRLGAQALIQTLAKVAQSLPKAAPAAPAAPDAPPAADAPAAE